MKATARPAGVQTTPRQRLLDALIGGLRELTATTVESGGRMRDVTDEAVGAALALLGPPPKPTGVWVSA